MPASFGINAEDALRGCRSPQGYVFVQDAEHDSIRYFACMEAVGRLADDEDAAVKIASAEGFEQSSPPIFTAYCSRDGRACIGRLARYKRLIGPMEFNVHEGGVPIVLSSRSR
jgi:hypothetical protein